MTLINKQAPNFIASAIIENNKIINNFNLKNYLNGNIGILFFWPVNFVKIYSLEIISFNKNYEKFKERNVKLIGISCDSEFSHNIWKSISIKKNGIGNIKFPIISDIKREIIKFFNIENPNIGIALKSIFIINIDNIIKFELINDLPFITNINELIRVIDSIILLNKNISNNKNLSKILNNIDDEQSLI